jgi:putative tryptophan/tyrosine transport system substrate-binding protein
MRRREFISILGGTAATWPLAARGQQPSSSAATLRFGFVHPVSPKGIPPSYVEFIKRLEELGYVEGDTLTVEYINLEGHLDRYVEAMRELVRRRVDLIFALGQEDNLRSAMAATSTIPIVMLAIGYDPVAKGYVKSLAQPGGNVTGIYVLSLEAVSKRLQLFKDAFPQQSKAFGFWDFDGADTWRAATEAAPSLGIALFGIELKTPPYDYEGEFAKVPPEFRRAMFLPSSAVFTSDAERLAAFALRHQIAACFDASPRYAKAGALMSYGPDLPAAARRAAEISDRIVRGAKPSDLPVEQSTRFALTINLKTAKILGVHFPTTVLANADEVIE